MKTTTLYLACLSLLALLPGCLTQKYQPITVPDLVYQTPPRKATKAECALLMHAAATNDVQTVYELLSRGIDINTKAPNGETALHYALYLGHYPLAQWLIRSGADPDIPYEDSQLPIAELCRYPRIGMVYTIHDGKGDIIYTAEDWMRDRNETLRLIVASHKDPNEGLPLHRALEELCAAYGRTDIVAMLLRLGVDANRADAYGRTPLWYACINRNVYLPDSSEDVPYLLLKAGADPNVLAPSRPIDNFDGTWSPVVVTPLSAVINHAGRYPMKEERKLIRALLDAGADPTIVEGDGKTALDRAREKGNPYIIRLLEKAAGKRQKKQA